MSAQVATNPLPVLARIYRRHRLAQAAVWLARIATPLLGVAGVLHLMAVIWSGFDTGYVPVALAALSVVAWIPVYAWFRSSNLRIARKADLELEARGAVTATAELSMMGGARTAWGEAAVSAGTRMLEGADLGRLVPAGRFVPVLAPAAAALAVIAVSVLGVALPAKKVIPDPEFEDPDPFAAVPIFNAADEKMLERVHEKLRQKLAQIPESSTDERVEKLRKKIDEALLTFPEDEESYRKFIDDVESLKGDIDELIAEKQAEQELLEELGESIDAKLLQDLAEALEQGDTGAAAEIAQEMAEEFKEKNPPDKKMSQAAEELLEAIEKAEQAMQEKKDGAAGEKGDEGQKSEGGEKTEGEAGEPGESGADTSEMADLLKTLDKLAGMFGIKDAGNLPEGLKKLAEKFKGMDMSKEQAEELQKLVEGLDNLKNLMAGSGQGKKGYDELREQFENSASGQPGQPGQQGQQGQGQQGQPGQPGQGQQPGQGMQGQQGQSGSQGEGQPGEGMGAGPQGMGKQPGDGQGQGQQGEGGQGDGAGNQPGGVTGEAGEAPGNQADSQDGRGDGEQGWGTGTTDHMAGTGIEGGGAAYEDIEVEGEDNPGPIKKDVIIGASKDGFVNEDYKKVYEMYTSILQDILDGEDVPSIYRFYVDKYFELIAPREEP